MAATPNNNHCSCCGFYGTVGSERVPRWSPFYGPSLQYEAAPGDVARQPPVYRVHRRAPSPPPHTAFKIEEVESDPESTLPFNLSDL